MKAVKTVELDEIAKGSSAPESEPVKAAKPVKPAKTDTMKVKSFTIGSKHEQQINRMAAKLSAKEGKPVSASTALRYILDHMEGKTDV
ncbi:hypothetical protein K1718_27415 (plasmid) [Roseibium porphyridii]|uniref:CopG family transcriptional regulator n=1 Tax=Roseibium porphyridii TaxID=2866279 RepID=A0ABY8FJD7_9HYPH|nr:hypothetical protein [Roseibium sp. KMA01]WFE92658.1 hypothetical protein K1718_27415 [Roseibium sp. KMA01]